MNAVLLYNQGTNTVNGAIINMFEYFLAAYEYNKDIYFYLLNSPVSNKDYYINMIKDRYYLEGLEGFEDHIIVANRNILLRKKFDVVLSHSSRTVNRTKGLITTKKLMVIADQFLDNPNYFYAKNLYDVTYYGEMPYHYKDIEYKYKMLFDRYKKIESPEDNIFVHSPGNRDRSFLNEIPLPDKPIVFRRYGHSPNLFSQYTTFLYYHAHKWFDPSPRMMHESYFYGKDIIYINKWDLKDGSYFRYHDLMENGLKDRVLSKDDEIIRRLI